jgi:hypothetical protein
MPRSQHLFPLLFDLPLHLAKLMVRKTIGFGKLAIGQPELRLAATPTYMNVRWLAFIQTVEQELIASPS